MIGILFRSGLSFPEIVINVCVFVCALVFSFSIHEYMHAFAAYKCGDDTAKKMGRLNMKPSSHIDPTGAVMLLIFGFGWARPVVFNYSKITRFKNKKVSVRLISLAGVATNFVAAVIAFLLFLLTSIISAEAGILTSTGLRGLGVPFHLPASPSLLELFVLILIMFFYELFLRNIVLLAFNLIPIPPLDGYRFIETFFPQKIRSIAYRVEKFTPIIFIVLVMTGFLSTLVNIIASPFLRVIQLLGDMLLRLFGRL